MSNRGKRKTTSRPNSRSSSPLLNSLSPSTSPSLSPSSSIGQIGSTPVQKNDTQKYQTKLTSSNSSSSSFSSSSIYSALSSISLTFPQLRDTYPFIYKYISKLEDDFTFISSPTSPSKQLPSFSSFILSHVNQLKPEISQFLNDTKRYLNQILQEKDKLMTYVKNETKLDKQILSNIDTSKFNLIRSAMECLSPLSDKSNVATLKIKKTEGGEFKITSVLSPTKEGQEKADKSYKTSRRGSKNLSQMQSKSISSVANILSSPTKERKDKPPSAAIPQGSVVTKPVIPNQVTPTVFWNYLDQFFKYIGNEELIWLDPKYSSIDEVAEYLIIPPLGSSIMEEKMDGDVIMSDSIGNEISRLSSQKILSGDKGKTYNNLTSRILACFVEEKECTPSSFKDDDTSGTSNDEVELKPSMFNSSPLAKQYSYEKDDSAVVPDELYQIGANKRILDLEDRIRMELTSLGILSMKGYKDTFEDDEVCALLRQLQNQLRIQHALNLYRKKILYQFLLGQLAAQEYYHVLDELDRQIEASYNRRTQKQGKKRKRISGPLGGIKSLSEELSYHALSKRQLLVESFRSSILPREKLQFEYDSSHLFGHAEEEEFIKKEKELLPIPLIDLDTIDGSKKPSFSHFLNMVHRKNTITTANQVVGAGDYYFSSELKGKHAMDEGDTTALNGKKKKKIKKLIET